MISKIDIEEIDMIIDGEWTFLIREEYKTLVESIVKSNKIKILFEDRNRNDLWSCVISVNDSVSGVEIEEEEFFVSGFSDVSDIIDTGNKWWYLGYIIFYDPPESFY